MLHRVLRALFAGTLVWGLLLAAPVPGQVTAEASLTDGAGRIVVNNPRADTTTVTVRLHRWADTAQQNVGPRVPVTVWPDSVDLPPGTALRVVTTFAPPYPAADTAAAGVRTRLRHVLRVLTRATVR